MQRLRYLPGHGSHGAAVVQLGGQHALLHMAGKQGKQRQHQQQDQRKAGVLHRDHYQNGHDAAGVRRHADDAGGEQGFHRVHIAGKAGCHLTGVLAYQYAGRQPGQLAGHLGAQSVGHLLAEQHQQALLRGGQPPFQRKAAKIEQHRLHRQRDACRQPVDDAGQQQRRHQRRPHRPGHAQEGACGQDRMCPSRHADGGKYAVLFRFFPVLHAGSPPFAAVWLSYSWRYSGTDAISSSWVPTVALPPSRKTTCCICGKWYSRWEMRNTTLSFA